MTTERQRQQAEDRRELAEDGRRHTEKQRDIDEHNRQMAEEQREVGELLRDTERAGERLIIEYSTRALLTRIEGFEERLFQLESRLESIEALLRTIHGQLHQLLSGASGKSLVELGQLYKETYDGHQAEKADGGRAVSD